jgi:hypothetical protein
MIAASPGHRYYDPTQHQGEETAAHVIAAVRAGTSDPDYLMRALLRAAVDGGVMVPPTSALRGLCARLQRELSGGGRDAT